MCEVCHSKIRAYPMFLSLVFMFSAIGKCHSLLRTLITGMTSETPRSFISVWIEAQSEFEEFMTTTLEHCLEIVKNMKETRKTVSPEDFYRVPDGLTIMRITAELNEMAGLHHTRSREPEAPTKSVTAETFNSPKSAVALEGSALERLRKGGKS